MKVQLIKLDGGKNLRTSTVEGVCVNYPEEGKPFTMVGDSLTDQGDLRIVQTSKVVKIERPESDKEEYILTTHSGSKYHVEIMQ